MAQQLQAKAQESGRPAEAGAASALLGMVYGSALLIPAEDPNPYFERALELLTDAWERGQALRRYGAYLRCNGRRAAARGLLAEAAALFEQLGARGELAKARRLLAGEDAPGLRW